MHINNPHLKKLAEGRTEITTKMICEAERLENEPSLAYERYMAFGMQNIYGNNEYYGQQSRALEHYYSNQAMNAQLNRNYSYGIGLLGYCGGLTPEHMMLGRCPYCGK